MWLNSWESFLWILSHFVPIKFNLDRQCCYISLPWCSKISCYDQILKMFSNGLAYSDLPQWSVSRHPWRRQTDPGSCRCPGSNVIKLFFLITNYLFSFSKEVLCREADGAQWESDKEIKDKIPCSHPSAIGNTPERCSTWVGFITLTPGACSKKFYDCKFTIINYASLWSVTYDHNLWS